MRLRGAFDLRAFEGATESILAHEAYREGVPRLWDMREADLSKVSLQDMREAAGILRKGRLGASFARVSVVVSRDVDFGVGRMFDSIQGRSLPPPTSRSSGSGMPPPRGSREVRCRLVGLGAPPHRRARPHPQAPTSWLTSVVASMSWSISEKPRSVTSTWSEPTYVVNPPTKSKSI